MLLLERKWKRSKEIENNSWVKFATLTTQLSGPEYEETIGLVLKMMTLIDNNFDS